MHLQSVKGEIDDYFVKYYGLKSKDELMPWNYQNRFFQEAPKIYEVDLDKYYADKNLETLDCQLLCRHRTSDRRAC